MTSKDTFDKNGKTLTRTIMHPDREYTAPDAKSPHGRSLMLIRNVGHLMTNPAILVEGEEIFEGIMDRLSRHFVPFQTLFLAKQPTQLTHGVYVHRQTKNARP